MVCPIIASRGAARPLNDHQLMEDRLNFILLLARLFSNSDEVITMKSVNCRFPVPFGSFWNTEDDVKGRADDIIAANPGCPVKVGVSHNSKARMKSVDYNRWHGLASATPLLWGYRTT